MDRGTGTCMKREKHTFLINEIAECEGRGFDAKMDTVETVLGEYSLLRTTARCQMSAGLGEGYRVRIVAGRKEGEIVLVAKTRVRCEGKECGGRVCLPEKSEGY